ncbi:MAG TPA: hypothetical protein VFP20_09335 [Bacteroidales bacterium]|nr:hypothetical protein [Bacteroidales bacterium]
MKRLALFIFASVLTVGLYAQVKSGNQNEVRKQRWEEMKAKRAAYYTEKIDLTSQEAQLFWPVFNELQEKKWKLHQQMSAQFRNGKKDDQGKPIINYSKVNDELIRIKVSEANLDKIYHEKFKRILSPEKLFLYYGAERDWANKLLKDLEKRGDKK